MKLTPELLEAIDKAAKGIEHGSITIFINSEQKTVDIVTIKRSRFYEKLGWKKEPDPLRLEEKARKKLRIVKKRRADK